MDGVPLSVSQSARPLGTVLREARQRKKMSLRSVADGTGISYSTLSRIETGERDSASLDALLIIGRRLGLSQTLISELAGGLSREGIRELVGADIRRSLRGGRLSPEGVQALRRVHLGQLLEPLRADLAIAPVDLVRVARAVGVRIVTAAAAEPGFDSDGKFFLPQRARSPLDRVVERAWIAHGLAHALIAADAGERPLCRPRAQALAREREATFLASLILVPAAALASALRMNPVGEVVTGEEMGAVLEEISSDFAVPAPFAAARLTEDAALAVIPL